LSTYGGYIERLSRRIDARLDDIEAVFNFDLGTEFEVAMCLLLEDILPAKFGVCRGFIVTEDGRQAGDDLIVYDKMACPTLRANVAVRYSVKEQIPADAVYAYIECKHSIGDAAVFEKAMKQARAVKKLLFTREGKKNPDYKRDGPVFNGKVRDWPRSEPPLKNQPFCCVIARQFDAKLVESETVRDELTPDLLVLGRDHIGTQSVLLGRDGIKGALFFDARYWAGLRIEKTEGQAFGIGIVSLLQALGKIELVPIDWRETLSAAFAAIIFGKGPGPS